MAGLLFVSQAMLDGWVGQGRIELEGHVMTLRAGGGQGRSYALDPSVRFLRVVGADADPHALVGKVKRMAQLRELGAEALGDSVVLGDVAYEVQPGFMAEANAVQAAATVVPQRPPAPPPAGPSAGPPAPHELNAKRKEAEALARFLLDNLS
jgi:hypothetical protein